MSKANQDDADEEEYDGAGSEEETDNEDEPVFKLFIGQVSEAVRGAWGRGARIVAWTGEVRGGLLCGRSDPRAPQATTSNSVAGV